MKTSFRTRYWLIYFFVIITIFVIGSSNVRADVTLFSDNFNTENSGTPVLNYFGFTNWNVTGYVDLIGSGSGGTAFDFYPGHGLYVDMGGSGSTTGTLTTKNLFGLTPGTYQLQFDLAGSTRGQANDIAVSLDGLYSQTFTLVSSAPWTTYTETITVNSPTIASLVFADSVPPGGNPQLGAILDNVILTQITTPVPSVPEPGALFLLGLGLFGLAGVRKKFKK